MTRWICEDSKGRTMVVEVEIDQASKDFRKFIENLAEKAARNKNWRASTANGSIVARVVAITEPRQRELAFGK